MFENYREMSPEQQQEVKRIHKSIRALPLGRYRNLVWAYVRGFPYRRVERSHRIQVIPQCPCTCGEFHTKDTFEHNLPSVYTLMQTIGRLQIPIKQQDIEVWLANPDGAIPAPPPRPKKSSWTIVEIEDARAVSILKKAETGKAAE